MIDIPCTCGHRESVHIKHGGISNRPDVMCTECFVVPYSHKIDHKDHWHYFVQDNLSYIERLAKKRNLI